MRRRGRPGSKVCVLISGGLDSCVLLGVMAQQFRETVPVYIQCGLRWEKAEIYWLRKYLKMIDRSSSTVRNQSLAIQHSVIHPLTVLSLPVRDVYGPHWSLPRFHQNRGVREAINNRSDRVPDRDSSDEQVYLPGRNLLLLSKAAVFCARERIQIIAMGQLKGNPFPDATPRFFRSAEKALSLALNYPIRILSPFLTLSKAEVMKVGKQLGLPLNLSFSCLAPIRNRRPCGKCNKCAEGERAMGY
ncbi:MAG: 7-cyano-7-deazaguanine synthase [Acidobacteriia bacterium]|nr:7-cyano-7-deazaguanine synthase [Terriglobia bacterium]